MFNPQGYDLIGDIHGCAASLELLLQKMGYSKQQGVYSHPERKVVFLGDIVDRGPRIREAVHLVKAMVDAGHAYIVMGNHEYNLLSYMTENGLEDADGKKLYLREHTPRHFRILKETIEQFEPYPGEMRELLDWIRNMPLFLEFDNFRVVHACWHQELVDQYNSKYADQTISEELLRKSVNHGTFEWTVFDRLLRGTHLRLPNGEEMVSRDGFRRRFFRTKFWLEEPVLYADVVFQPDPLPSHIALQRITEEDHQDLLYYNPAEKPLFIGHYWREGTPAPITNNIACLDYSAVKFGKLVAYQMDGEKELSSDKFIWVDVAKEINQPNAL